MEQVNYKQLRAYKNLPRYDVGASPISSGRQINANLSLAGYYLQPATPITNSFVPQAITSGIADLANTGMMLFQGGMFNKSKSGTSPVSNTTNTASTSTTPNQTSNTGGGIANLAFGGVNSIQGLPAVNEEVDGGELADAMVIANKPDLAAQSAAGNEKGGSGGKSGNTALAVVGGVTNTLDMLNTITDTSTLGTSDLLSMSSKQTNYINGVGYETYGGYDKAGADKYVKNQNKAATIGGITKGMAAGASVGSIFGPYGTAIGAGIGGLVGGIGSIFGNKKRKRKMLEAQRKWNVASNAYNMLSESEAGSQALQNEFYATHADKGLSPNFKNPNALVQGGEPIVTVNGKGNVVRADMFPITPLTPERVDNIPVKLDLGNSKHGVIGNKIDPFTGQRLAVEGRSAVLALNDPTVKNKQPYKEKLKYLLDLQEVLPDNRDMKNNRIPKYNFGKCLPMLDAGWAYSAIPTALNLANSIIGLQSAKKEPISVRDSYTPNYQALQAAALMPTTVNIDPELESINNATRLGNYAINQSAGLSGGQKMSMLNQLFNDRMTNMANTYANKTDRENQLKTNFANFLYTSGEAEATRRLAAKQKYNEDLRQAVAAKQQLVDTSRKDFTKAVNSGFKNASDWYMFKKTTDQYQQELDQHMKELIAQYGEDALSGRNKKAGKDTKNKSKYIPMNTIKNTKPYNLSTPDLIFSNYMGYPNSFNKIRRMIYDNGI